MSYQSKLFTRTILAASAAFLVLGTATTTAYADPPRWANGAHHHNVTIYKVEHWSKRHPRAARHWRQHRRWHRQRR